jgi:hypothetical protein
MSTRSRWEFVGKTGGIVFIRDLDLGGRSVTNDAEQVYDECQKAHGACRVVYQDSDGEWWEIVATDHAWEGYDVTFRPWHGLVWDRLSKVSV